MRGIGRRFETHQGVARGCWRRREPWPVRVWVRYLERARGRQGCVFQLWTEVRVAGPEDATVDASALLVERLAIERATGLDYVFFLQYLARPRQFRLNGAAIS